MWATLARPGTSYSRLFIDRPARDHLPRMPHAQTCQASVPHDAPDAADQAAPAAPRLCIGTVASAQSGSKLEAQGLLGLDACPPSSVRPTLSP